MDSNSCQLAYIYMEYIYCIAIIIYVKLEHIL